MKGPIRAFADMFVEVSNAAKQEGAAAERAAIVEWLRSQADPDRQTRDDKDRLIKTIYYADLANAIERRDHIQPEPASR